MNIQGLHNLCVVYVERGKLKRALECLQRAHKLAPEERYILKHLNIVKQRILDQSQAAAMQKEDNIPINGNIDDTGNKENDSIQPETKYAENNTTTTDNIKSNEKHMENSNNKVDKKTSTTTQNQKHSDGSTISEATNSIKPNGIRRHDDPPKNKIRNDAVDAETENNGRTEWMNERAAPNRRAEPNEINHERTNTPTTKFGQDSDEPSSGTS